MVKKSLLIFENFWENSNFVGVERFPGAKFSLISGKVDMTDKTQDVLFGKGMRIMYIVIGEYQRSYFINKAWTREKKKVVQNFHYERLQQMIG